MEFNSDWLTRESRGATSYLNANYTISEGTWLYRLGFENTDLQTNRTVELSVIEYWTGIDFRDIIVPSFLLPYGYIYIGATASGAGLAASVWGIATKRFTLSDLSRPLRMTVGTIAHHIGTREFILAIMPTFTLAFISIFAHTRLGVGEIPVEHKMTKTFMYYRGFPLEMIGTPAPLTPEDFERLFVPEIEVFKSGHGGAQVTTDILLSYNEPEGGRLLILWAGLLPNFLLYFAVSFFFLVAVSCLREETERGRYYSYMLKNR